MHRKLFALLIILSPLAATHAEEWRPLFNGKDLTGWTPKITGRPAGENFADTFRVEDGLLKVRFDKYEGDFNGRFGHLFCDTPLYNYRLRVEYRMVGQQMSGGPGWARANSGVMIYGQSPESMALDQNFPVSLEVQLLAGLGKGPRPTANLCTPGTNVVLGGKLHKVHCTSSKSETYPVGQWVAVEVEARGDEYVRHLVNGELVLEYEKPQLDPRDGDATKLTDAGAELPLLGGTISLQSESHPVDFRSVEWMPLD
ncbi:MAG: DUF1080 domain-containing protein [Planctomycetota bacterium]